MKAFENLSWMQTTKVQTICISIISYHQLVLAQQINLKILASTCVNAAFGLSGPGVKAGSRTPWHHRL